MTKNRPLTRELFILAGPMMLSFAADTINMFVDRLFLARVDEESMSAAMTGGLAAYTILSFFIGALGFTAPLISQHIGGKQKDKCASIVMQGGIASLAFIPFAIVLPFVIGAFYTAIGHAPSLVLRETSYFSILIAGGSLFLFKQILSGFFLGTGDSNFVLRSNIVGMFVNIPANYLLIFGNEQLGISAMGINGAAIGTLIGTSASLFVLLFHYFSKEYREQYKTGQLYPFDKKLFFKYIRFGIPAGIESFLGIFSFNLFIQYMHTYGREIGSAVSIVFNWNIIVFIPLFGFSQAITSLVGNRMGNGNIKEAESIPYIGLQLGLLYVAVMLVFFMVTPDLLIALFARQFGGGEEIYRIATRFFRLAWLYHTADLATLVFTGALRGAGDTKAIMFGTITLNYLFFGLIIFLIIQGHPPYTAWLLFVALIVSKAILFFIRHRRGAWKRIEVIDRTEKLAPAESVIETESY